MAYFLAIDAGGTKADFVLADESRILGRVRTGTIKRMRTDADSAVANLEAALHALTAQTGVSPGSIAQTCIGTAGETVPLVTEFLRQEMTARVSGGLLLLGDVEIALDAAFPGAPGVVILAGTGSNVAGRRVDGRIEGAGGWGPMLADQGSGNRIGHEALRRAVLAFDEDGSSALLDALLGFWGLSTMDELVAFANSDPLPDFSRLTPTVVEFADRGDAIAREVLLQQAEDLAYLARLVLRRIMRDDGDGATPGMAFTGSVIENVTLLRNAIVAAVRREFPSISVVEGVIGPVLGALWRARAEFPSPLR